MNAFLVSLLLLVASPVSSAQTLPIDSAAWVAADMLDSGRWEQAADYSLALWQRCQQEPQTDTETCLLVLQTLCDALKITGQTEQALAYTRIVYSIAQQAGNDYALEQIEALTDMSQLNADLANIPDAMNQATDALDKMTAYVSSNMSQWVANADVEAIISTCELAEDVTFASLNAIEDCYTAADEQHRELLRNHVKLDDRIAQLQTFCAAINATASSASGKRKHALTAVDGLFRHLLCHTLLLAQRMLPDNDSAFRKGKEYVEQVFRVARTDESAYTRATARMAVCYTLAGKYDSTLVWLNRLEQIDADGVYRNMIEENRAWIAATDLNWQTALPLLKSRFESKKQQLLRDFYSMTPAARQHIWLSNYLWYFRQNIALCLGRDFPPQVQAFLYDNVLSEKGVLLSAETDILSQLRKQGNSADALCDSLYALRKSNSLISNTLEAQTYANRLLQYLSASQQVTDLSRLLNLTYRDVQSRLGSNDIAVEFIQDDSDSDKQMYALVLRSKWNAPRLVHLGPSDLFAPLQQRSNLLKPEFKRLVWDPVISTADIKQGERIYFAPDGMFYLTGIEYLLVDTMNTMFDTYEMHRLSSTRELCRADKHVPHLTSDTTLLYGGVCYDAEGTYSSVKYLPATLAEITAIDSIVPHTIAYTCLQATEHSFRSLSTHAPRIIHVATHGFYLPAPPTHYTAQNLLNMRLADGANVNIEDYAMSRSGLLLAGAGTAWGESDYKNYDDGILTAKEIALLDLQRTDLVVLSACQTGLGDITVDGVAGLQRGFKKAGCGSMLLSLWQVDDKATKILMTDFYRHLAAGKTPTQAFQQAQYALRTFTQNSPMADRQTDVRQHRARPYLRAPHLKQSDAGAKYPYSSPYYWAAFVLLDAK